VTKKEEKSKLGPGLPNLASVLSFDAGKQAVNKQKEQE
jgi:hypothetical protein